MAILTVKIEGRRRPDVWKVIVARFEGQCVVCRARIAVGQEALWRRGTGLQCTEHQRETPQGIPEPTQIDARSYRLLSAGSQGIGSRTLTSSGVDC